MKVIIRVYETDDLKQMIEIWNEVVDEGVAYPQTKGMRMLESATFFAEQSYSAVAQNEITDEILGLYILHPNNIGRCGHIANASYAVRSDFRGQGIGTRLVQHSLSKAKELGFSIMQFNAVVKTNESAIHLYEKLGFVKLGEIPKGFRLKNDTYEDIILYYKKL